MKQLVLSPYDAVLGRIPAVLPGDDTMMSDNVPDDCSRHIFRVREIAVQAIAEGTARERIRLALHSKTQPAGAELKVGQSVDWHRPPANTGASLEHGRVGIRTDTDQVITCRLQQDVRHSLTLWSVVTKNSRLTSHSGSSWVESAQTASNEQHTKLVC